MNIRKLGRTGLDVSQIGLGCAPFGSVNLANEWDPFSAGGRKTVVETINRALDLGVNYIDTAPRYGAGNSESLVGEVMKDRRDECVLATKVWFELDEQGVIDSVHESMKRLQTDYIDVVQVHGRMYTDSEYKHIVHGGPLDGLRRLREEGKIGFIGVTAEESWTVIPFLGLEDFSVFQIAYNFIYQSAARHFLISAAEAQAGVVSMRTMTSGILQREAEYIAPEWQAARDLYEVSLRFVLADSRVHSALIGMRWADEVEHNVKLAENWVPPIDFAALPRLTVDIYKAQDFE